MKYLITALIAIMSLVGWEDDDDDDPELGYDPHDTRQGNWITRKRGV